MAHFEKFIGVEKAEPVMLMSIVSDAAFHNTRLKALACSNVNRVGFDIGEIKHGGRHVIRRLNRVRGEWRVGAVVVEVKVPDAMVVVVVA